MVRRAALFQNISGHFQAKSKDFERASGQCDVFGTPLQPTNVSFGSCRGRNTDEPSLPCRHHPTHTLHNKSASFWTLSSTVPQGSTLSTKTAVCFCTTPVYANYSATIGASFDFSIREDFWSDQDQREQIIKKLREGGGDVLNEEVVWKTKTGEPVSVLVSYPQVAYRGRHIGFAGGKRVAWIYDITALRQREEQLAEQSVNSGRSSNTARPD